ncbi:gp436 family protein, partial [Pasteurella multocida]
MYATINDFISRVGEFQVMELTDRENIGEVNQAVLTIALLDSSSQIDGYLVGRYKLPLKTIPQNLTRICCDLTRYRLASMSD